jgi:hypothetical protein
VESNVTGTQFYSDATSFRASLRLFLLQYRWRLPWMKAWLAALTRRTGKSALHHDSVSHSHAADRVRKVRFAR